MAFIERSGFASIHDLTTNLVDVLKDTGYKIIASRTASGEYVAILEPTVVADAGLKTPNMDTWRIAFQVKDLNLSVHVAPKEYLRDDGTIAAEKYLTPYDGDHQPGLIENFVQRDFLDTKSKEDFIYPMSYTLCVTDHGIFIAISDHYNEDYQNIVKDSKKLVTSPRFSWLLVQRLISADGTPHITGKAPVHCLFTKMATDGVEAIERTQSYAIWLYENTPNVTPWNEQKLYTKDGGFYTLTEKACPKLAYDELGNEYIYNASQDYPNGDGSVTICCDYYRKFKSFPIPTKQIHRQFVALESDVNRPSHTTPADFGHDSYAPLLNSENQVSVTEEGKALINIPKGVATSRYYYPHSLDMIAYCSADLVGEASTIELTKADGKLYRYKALDANRLGNVGMRILVLVDETEISTDYTVVTTTPPPIPTESEWKFAFTKLFNNSILGDASKLTGGVPENYDVSRDGYPIWTQAALSGWVGCYFRATSNKIRLRFTCDDSFKAFIDRGLVLEGADSSSWHEVIVDAIPNTYMFLSVNVVNAGGVRGLVGVVSDALSGNTIVKTDTSWISG